MDEAAIAALTAKLSPPADSDGVWPEHVAAVTAFLSAQTQWRTAVRWLPSGVAGTWWIGLDYAGARVAIEAAGIAITPALWARLATIEHAAIAALNAE
jgi:hypothetical protein